MLSGVVNDTDKQKCVLTNVRKTSTVFERMRGLLFRTKLEPMQALWIEPCPSVHTIGMKYPIDVIFLDKNGLVLKVVENLLPMRMAMCNHAVISLEMLSGCARQANIHAGIKLNWKHEDNN